MTGLYSLGKLSRRGTQREEGWRACREAQWWEQMTSHHLQSALFPGPLRTRDATGNVPSRPGVTSSVPRARSRRVLTHSCARFQAVLGRRWRRAEPGPVVTQESQHLEGWQTALPAPHCDAEGNSAPREHTFTPARRRSKLAQDSLSWDRINLREVLKGRRRVLRGTRWPSPGWWNGDYSHQ